MVGMAHREESELSMCGIAVTYERHLYVQYTPVMIHNPVVLITPGSRPLPAWLAVVK